jgi:hypothetical protein
VVIEFEGGDGISLDPFSFSGIRIGAVPDLSMAMKNLPNIGAVQVFPRPNV